MNNLTPCGADCGADLCLRGSVFPKMRKCSGMQRLRIICLKGPNGWSACQEPSIITSSDRAALCAHSPLNVLWIYTLSIKKGFAKCKSNGHSFTTCWRIDVSHIYCVSGMITQNFQEKNRLNIRRSYRIWQHLQGSITEPFHSMKKADDYTRHLSG